MQAADLRLRNAGAVVAWGGGATVSATGTTPVGQEESKLLDNNSATKFLDFDFQNNGFVTVVTIDNGANITFDGYDYVTGGDADYRDPWTWTLAGSLDGVNWRHLHRVDNGTGVASGRSTACGPYTISEDAATVIGRAAFFDINGLALASYFPETGGAFASASSGSNTLFFSGARLCGNIATANTPVFAVFTPASATPNNVEVACRVNHTTLASHKLGVLFRYQDTSNYGVFWYNNGNMVVGKRVAGVFTTLASVAHTPTAGVSYDYTAVVSGDNVLCYRDGVELTGLAITGGGFPTTGKSGLVLESSITGSPTDSHFQRFSSTESVASVTGTRRRQQITTRRTRPARRTQRSVFAGPPAIAITLPADYYLPRNPTVTIRPLITAAPRIRPLLTVSPVITQ